MFTLALKNLTRRRSRTILTILGVVVAIGFMVGILSISTGFINNFTKTVKSGNIDIYVLPAGTNSLTGMFAGSAGGAPKDLNQTLQQDIQNVSNVESVYPILEIQDINQSAGGNALSSFVPNIIEAVPPEAVSVLSGATFDSGRIFYEEESGVILGSNVAKDKNLAVGDTTTIHDRAFQVVGILKASGTLIDGITLMPLKTAQDLFNKQSLISYFGVKVSDINQVDDTANLIKLTVAGVNTITSQEFLKQVVDLLKIARAIHFSLASVALMIGVLFVLTTMLMAAAERVKEIGTLRAIGASRQFIFQMILIESFIISSIGGFIGIGFGILMAVGLTKIISLVIGITSFQAEVTWGLAALGFGIAILIGLLAGLYPAWNISRINIVKALHYE
jgi:putative ABC transport system permease protein